MQKLDTLTDGYESGDILCMDGTEIAFERIRKDRITSGRGNICIAHYMDLGAAVLAAIRAFANLPHPPAGNGWYSREP